MTREEAIEYIKCGEISNRWGKEGEEAERMAIEALSSSEKPNKWIVAEVLDKIRAEIDSRQYDFMDAKDYDEGIRFGLMLAYQIIDKYEAEGSEE